MSAIYSGNYTVDLLEITINATPIDVVNIELEFGPNESKTIILDEQTSFMNGFVVGLKIKSEANI